MRTSVHGDPRLRLVGQGAAVPLVTGETRPYVNLDYAASAPSLEVVAGAVQELLTWYSSVHRGAGFKSRISTEAYEGARAAIAALLSARDDDVVVITRNTTDATNLLAASLSERAKVFTFAGEHHANLLPWRRLDDEVLPIPASAREAVQILDDALRRMASESQPGQWLVTVAGAGNVTGEIWPLAELARVAHRHGARLFVDAAQLAPHAAIDMATTGIDYLALSGHKLYAPFGAGALVGRPDWLSKEAPFLRGGGAVNLVTAGEVLWADLPDRQEAGSPNVVGAVALGVACDALQDAGMDRLASEEADLLRYASARLGKIPGLDIYRLWDSDHPRVGLLTFNLQQYRYDLVASVLSAEHGIGVRHGCFCAHLLMAHLLRIGDVELDRYGAALRSGERPHLPGAVRASFGLATSPEDIDALATALESIASTGPRWEYGPSPETGELGPVRDPRAVPSVSFRLGQPR